MKNLYESILDDIDVQMQQGDDWAKEIEKEKKEFLKVLGAAKNYEGGYSLKNARSNKVFTPNALHELGFDANHIHIFMYTMDSFNYTSSTDDWVLEITLSKRSDDDMRHISTVWEKKVYMDRWSFDKWNSVVKNLLKPAAKSLDTFKKFLNNMEKWNEQLVGTKLLLN